jgi:hypothetical protein
MAVLMTRCNWWLRLGMDACISSRAACRMISSDPFPPWDPVVVPAAPASAHIFALGLACRWYDVAKVGVGLGVEYLLSHSCVVNYH